LATRTLLFMFFLRAEEDEAEAEAGGYVYEDEYKSAWDESDAQEWDGELKTREFSTGWDGEDIRGYDFFATTRDEFARLPRRSLRGSVIPSPAPPPPSTSTLEFFTSPKIRDNGYPPPTSPGHSLLIPPATPPPLTTTSTSTITIPPSKAWIPSRNCKRQTLLRPSFQHFPHSQHCALLRPPLQRRSQRNSSQSQSPNPPDADPKNKQHLYQNTLV